MSKPNEPNRRVKLIDEISERTGITDDLIAVLVETFYERARHDPLLAPAFADVENWDEHLTKLRAFWSSVVLMSGQYHGQPMQAHYHLPIEPRQLPLMSARLRRLTYSWRKPVGSPTASKWP